MDILLLLYRVSPFALKVTRGSLHTSYIHTYVWYVHTHVQYLNMPLLQSSTTKLLNLPGSSFLSQFTDHWVSTSSPSVPPHPFTVVVVVVVGCYYRHLFFFWNKTQKIKLISFMDSSGFRIQEQASKQASMLEIQKKGNWTIYIYI